MEMAGQTRLNVEATFDHDWSSTETKGGDSDTIGRVHADVWLPVASIRSANLV